MDSFEREADPGVGREAAHAAAFSRVYEHRRLTRPVLLERDSPLYRQSESRLSQSALSGVKASTRGTELAASRRVAGQFSGSVDPAADVKRPTGHGAAATPHASPAFSTFARPDAREEDAETDSEEEYDDEDEEEDEYEEEEASPLRPNPQIRRSPRFSASLRLERQPLPREGDPANPAPPAPRRVSLWGSILMHARRSLPFLGCDGPDGSLPPSPKPPAYASEDLHQFGVSLLSSLSAPRFLARKIGKNLEHRLHALCPDDAGSGGTGATRLCRGTEEEHGGESKNGVSCSAGSFSSLSRFPASESTAHRRLEKNSFTPLNIRAHRVGAFDAPDVATLLWASLRRRLSQCLVFFFFLSVLFGVYRHLAWTASFSEPDGDLRTEVPRTSAGRGSASAWLVEKEIQKLRRELEEEREALSDYRERMQMQLKKHVASLTQKVQENLESQRKDLEHLFVKLREEKRTQGEMEEGEQTQQLLADVDNLQEEIRGLEKRNEALETTVDDMRRSLATLAQKQDEGPQKSLLTEAFARKVEDLYTHLVVEEEQTIDWALESLGGRIVVSETAPPLLKPPSWASSVSAAMWSLVHGEEAAEAAGAAGFWAHKKPAVMLQPDRHAGSCYAFRGERGTVAIQLPTAVFVTSVAIDDVASDLFTASAPRRFRLWGFEDPRASSSSVSRNSFTKNSEASVPSESNCGVLGRGRLCGWLSGFLIARGKQEEQGGGDPSGVRDSPLRVFLGEFEVKQRKKLVLFELKERPVRPMRKIVFEFLNNFGHPYTCIYRLRVHGEKAVLQSTSIN
ncbi:UNVERIFIED_CONTAM: Sad1 / UNC family C-terminal protein [Hammondia hammondi]|eukprot:XP_008888667.1 Sad1 / UNC family C-terminal protein [Hammondia hammondi]